jgi:hypothetical protein
MFREAMRQGDSYRILGLNIFVITELMITTLFCPDIKSVTSDVLTRTFLLLQQAK